MQHFISEKNSENIFVLLHGTGGNEFSLLFLTGQLDPKASIVSFLGEHGISQERRYFSLPQGDTLDQTNFAAAVVDFLEEWDRLNLDYLHTTFIGYSNGANLLQGILQQRPTIADRTILLHPQEFHLEFPTHEKAANEILITTGANDPLVIPGATLALSNRLKKSFMDVELLLTDGEHGVTDEEIFKVHKWWRK